MFEIIEIEIEIDDLIYLCSLIVLSQWTMHPKWFLAMCQSHVTVNE